MTSPQSLDTALRLDRQFQKVLFEVEQRTPHLSRHYQTRIKKWIKCLTQPTSNNTWKRNRNQYCQLLLYQLVDKGRLAEPFDSEPQMGPLQNLPANALTEWRSSQRSTSRWRSHGGAQAAGTDQVRNSSVASSASAIPYCGSCGGPSFPGLGVKPGEVAKRSVSAMSGRAVCKGSTDSQLGSAYRRSFTVDSRDTGSNPVLFDVNTSCAAVEGASSSVASGYYSFPHRQSHSVPRKSHRKGENAHYVDMQHKVQQCQDVLRRQNIHLQTQKSRQPFSSLADSLNLPHHVLDVDRVGSRSTTAYHSGVSPARPTELLDVRQLQRPSSPPVLSAKPLKLQPWSQYNSAPLAARRSTALRFSGACSSLACSDDSSTEDASDPSSSSSDLSTQAPSPVSTSVKSSAPTIRSSVAVSLDAHHQRLQKTSAAVVLPEPPDVEEDQRILAEHLNRMKAADDNLRRTSQLRNAV